MPEYITTEEAHRQSGYTIQHLVRLLREGKLVGRRFGRVWQIDPDSLGKYLADARASYDRRRGPRGERSDER